MRVCIAVCLFCLSLSAFCGEYSWDKPHAKVLPNGDLEWAPEPFKFEIGDSVRYIDFENGNDENAGTSKDSAWKHHPWDGNAGSKAKACKEVHSYVFKGGVIYRGALVGRESGEAGKPIRLTRDPSWGKGPAWIVGSQAITGGWTKGVPATVGIPEPGKVWSVELKDVAEPWCVWLRDGDKATRIHLARHPNWTISNPDFVMEEWLAFDGPSRHKKKSEGGAPIGSRKSWDEEFLKDPNAKPDRFEGGRIWTMWSGGPFSAMGTPYDSPIESYDPKTGTIERQGMGGAFYFGMSGKGDRYYIERVPEFLDSPGEFYFKANEGGKGGTLFIRLPGDADPNQATVEIAQEEMLLKLYDTHCVDITGLRFSFLNVPDYFNFPRYPLDMRLPTAIMLYGDCRNMHIANNDFYHAAKAVQARTRITQRWMPDFVKSLGITERKGLDYMTDIYLTDNHIREADHGAISFQGHGRLMVKGSPDHKLGKIKILRNRLHRINFRPRPPSPGLNIPAIAVDDGTQIEIAGNIITRSWGVGIWITGGKQNNSDIRDRPLIRNHIHHNKVLDSLLVVNDWGAIALWQGGPQYAWCNYVGNAVGPHPHSQGELEEGRAEKHHKKINHFRSYSHNGYAYYLDGSYKQYVFNNIAWGKGNDPESWFKNRSPQMMVLGFLNQWFNNSFNKFLAGATGSSGTHSTALANIYADMGGSYISQGISGDISTAYGGENAADTLRIGLPTLGYANNVFQGPASKTEACFGLGTKGAGSIRCSTNSVEEFRKWLKDNGALAYQAGWMVERSPFANADSHDFRPNPSVMKDKSAVKFFVPYSLYMVVGEWDFSINRNNTELIMGQNLYMSDEYISRKMYYDIPRNDLDVPGGKSENFTKGRLENWTESALVFDGKSIFATLPHAKATADYKRTVALTYNDKNWLKTPSDPGSQKKRMRGGQLERWKKANAAWEKAAGKSYPGKKRKTVDMDTNNFLIEVYAKVKSGTLVSKTKSNSGYELAIKSGKAALSLKSNGKSASIIGKATIADGKWHHLIAEVDRKGNQLRLYVDGKLDAESELDLSTDLSIANTGDFFVGKGNSGYLTGIVDFLRVSRGTLADAQTTIDELYAWEFNGPFLKDFTGRTRNWTKTAPGAIDFE